MSTTDKDPARNIPEVKLDRTSTATTYHFRGIKPGEGWHGHAFVTVNDVTGELNIQSDYGCCCYRWHPDPTSWPTLTDFLAGRDSANYLADKLTAHHEGVAGRPAREVFDPRATVQHLKRMAGAEYRSGPLDLDDLRQVCRDLENLRGEYNIDRFLEAYFKIEMAVSHVCSEPWNEIQHEPTGLYLFLLYRLIPQLIEACRETVAERRRATMPACPLHSMPWFAGRWQDWHRGHGCNKDDGKPRTPEGEAEIAAGIAAGHPLTYSTTGNT